MSWHTVKASEIMLKRGGSVDPSKAPEEVFDLYSIPAYDRGIFDRLPGEKIGSSKYIIQPEDVLLSKIIPHIRRCQVVPSASRNRQIGSSEWIIFRSRIHAPNFLRHYLTSDPFHTKFMNTVAGVGGSLVRARPAAVAEFDIPVPPLEEQRRIAAILDKADAIRRKREQVITLTDDLLRSTFLDMFGDPVTNPKGWETILLEEIAEIRSGITKGRKTKQKDLHPVPYMRVANVQDGYLSLTEITTIDITLEEKARYLLERGDILLTEGGDPDKLGRGTVWNNEISTCIHQNHIFSVRINKNSAYMPEYLSALIGSQYGKRYFLRAGKQTTGIATINKTQLKNFPVHCPPLSLQKEYSNFILKHKSLKKSLQLQLVHQDMLFKTLSQRAFRGELTAKDLEAA
ncbi:restriction endonuclease subunit S [Hirschia litorea]|uniref:Restriction endonuclease subunit S n=1 Tax=Hirschia litorea TaxID=1199156 RepID=A0ABW2IN81_9PROT